MFIWKHIANYKKAVNGGINFSPFLILIRYKTKNKMERNIDVILTHYFIAALWTSEFDNHNVYEFSKETIETSKKDIEKFLQESNNYLIDLSNETIGHNFWLTRNRHGAGFWDLDELDNETGEIVSKICYTFKEVNVFENGNEMIIE